MMLKLRTHFLALGIAAGASSCAVTEPDDASPPAPELGELDHWLNGPGCGNGVAGAGELCLPGLPGSLVIDTEDQVHTLLAVDVDGDGDRDVLAMTRQRVWLRYAIPGGFAPAVWWWSTAGGQYMDLAVGDFDLDGDLDLAIADAGTGAVLIRRNDGGNSFPLTSTIPVGASPTRILSARLDANSRPDLVVLETGAAAAVVLLSTATGFAAPVSYAVGDAPDIAIGDCDASGTVDLLYVNGQGTAATIQARRNTGGVLAAPLSSSLPLYHAVHGYLYDLAIAAAFLDGAAGVDVAVSTSDSQLPTARSNGNCTFTPMYTPATMWNTNAWAYRLRVHDWDTDGRNDVAAAHGLLGPPPPGGDSWSIVFGDGAGSFTSGDAVPMMPGIGARDLAFLDADGDGDRDVLLGGFDGVILQANNP